MPEVVKIANEIPIVKTSHPSDSPSPPMINTLEELNELMNKADWSKTGDIQTIISYLMEMNKQKQQNIPTPKGGGKIKKVVIDYE